MSNDTPTDNGSTAEQPSQASGPRRWPWIVGIVVALGIGYGAGASGGDETEPVAEDITPEPQPTVTVTATVEADPSEERQAELDQRQEKLDGLVAELEERAAQLDEREAALEQTEEEIAEGTIPGDGIYLVGEDIQPGDYRGGGEGCYWARLSGTSGEFEDIIANGNVDGPTIVTIAESDAAFETVRCGEWTRQ